MTGNFTRIFSTKEIEMEGLFLPKEQDEIKCTVEYEYDSDDVQNCRILYNGISLFLKSSIGLIDEILEDIEKENRDAKNERLIAAREQRQEEPYRERY
jgi:hypothetical protein